MKKSPINFWGLELLYWQTEQSLASQISPTLFKVNELSISIGAFLASLNVLMMWRKFSGWKAPSDYLNHLIVMYWQRKTLWNTDYPCLLSVFDNYLVFLKNRCCSHSHQSVRATSSTGFPRNGPFLGQFWTSTSTCATPCCARWEGCDSQHIR